MNRVRFPTIVMAILLSGSTGTVQGQTAGESRDCGDLLQQQLMNRCFHDEAKAIEAVLQMLLSELEEKLETGKFASLLEVQAIWIETRDRQCAWEASFFEDGSIQPTILATCLIGMTEQRIQSLKYFLCDGSVMTGPCEASMKYDSRSGGLPSDSIALSSIP